MGSTEKLCRRANTGLTGKGPQEDTRAILEEAILFLTEVMRAGHTEKETFGWDLGKKKKKGGILTGRG